VGKTAVGCALIAATPELRWVAVKVTPHRHGFGKGLPAGLWEETERESRKDTGRYLEAGAVASFLSVGVNLPSKDECTKLFGEVSRRVPEATAWMVESGGIDLSGMAEGRGPVLLLAVLGCDVEQWKPASQARLASVAALVLPAAFSQDRLPLELQAMKSFSLAQGEWLSEELLHFVREGTLPWKCK